jgi:N-formylglutamate amidohydrolase
MAGQSNPLRLAFEAYDRAFLVDRLRGTLPVLLACAHDGTEQPEGVRARKREQFPAKCDFQPSGDLNVADLTRAAAEQLRAETGEAPYVVIAGFHRRYIDANRSEECALVPGPAQAYTLSIMPRCAASWTRFAPRTTGSGCFSICTARHANRMRLPTSTWAPRMG